MSKQKNMTRLAVLFTACGVLLLAVAVGGLFLRCRALEQRLDDVFTESLLAHTTMKGKGAWQLIEDTRYQLEDAAGLLEEDGRPLEKEWVDPILAAMSLGDRRSTLRLLAPEEMVGAEPGSEEQKVFRQALEGRAAVSDIICAQAWEETCFLVVQPVMRAGQVAGAVQARVSAGLLPRQGHDSTLFLTVYTVIAGEDGRVTYSSKAETRGLELTDLGLEDGMPQEDAEKFLSAYQTQEEGAFCYDMKKGRGYTAWASVGCNGWRVVQVSLTPDLRVEETSVVQTVVTLVSLVGCALLAALVWRQRARLAAEKLRYSTLAGSRPRTHDARRGRARPHSPQAQGRDLQLVPHPVQGRVQRGRKGPAAHWHPDGYQRPNRPGNRAAQPGPAGPPDRCVQPGGRQAHQRPPGADLPRRPLYAGPGRL